MWNLVHNLFALLAVIAANIVYIIHHLFSSQVISIAGSWGGCWFRCFAAQAPADFTHVQSALYSNGNTLMWIQRTDKGEVLFGPTPVDVHTHPHTHILQQPNFD